MSNLNKLKELLSESHWVEALEVKDSDKIPNEVFAYDIVKKIREGMKIVNNRDV